MYYTIEVRDKEGKLVKRLRRKSRSFVKAWNQIICAQADPDALQTIKDVNGADQAIVDNAGNLFMTAPAGTVARGIRLGTGTTAVTISDYAMATLIAEGIGTDELSHQACTITYVGVSGSDCSFTVQRVANNGSGATITVKEIGIHAIAYTSTVARYFLVIRDVLTTTVDVPDGGAITVVYTIKVTV